MPISVSKPLPAATQKPATAPKAPVQAPKANPKPPATAATTLTPTPPAQPTVTGAVKPSQMPKAPKVPKPEYVYQPPPPRPITYPDFKVLYFISGLESRADIPTKLRPGPISPKVAKDLIGWLTQSEYTARCTADKSYQAKDTTGKVIDDPTEGVIKESTLFANNPGLKIILTDFNGDEIICQNNDGNRTFRHNNCLKYVKSILNKDWAGPITWPGETCNGEPIIVSRTGRIISGQHRLIALILAQQLWDRNGGPSGKFGKNWPTGPILESIVVVGVSEDPRVLMTIDDVIPRTEADTIETSEIFGDVGPRDKRKLSVMLERAVELFWKRTGLATAETATTNVRTNAETMRLLRTHPSLSKCVRRIFEEDKQNGISKLHISAGQCAGLLYLMGSSSSEVNDYIANDPRTEDPLNWDNWDLANKFWTDLVKGNKNNDHPIAKAFKELAVLAEENDAAVKVPEKLAILSKAWKLYAEGKEITLEDIRLNKHEILLPEDDYIVDAKEEFHLKDGFDFGGIDFGHKGKKVELPLTPEQTAKAQKEEDEKAKEKAKEKAEKEAKKKKPSDTVAVSGKGIGNLPDEGARLKHELKLLRMKHVGAFLFFRTDNGSHVCWEEDALFLGENAKLGSQEIGVKEDKGMHKAEIPEDWFDNVLGQLWGKGRQVVRVKVEGGKKILEPLGAPAAGKAPPAKPKESTAAQKQPAVPAKKPVLRGGTGK